MLLASGKVNQRDVAREAGVSSASVSRYLNNPESVSRQAAAAISEAITKLDYRLDQAAQALRTGKSRHVGVLAPGAGEFHWTIFAQVQEVLREAGYFSTLYLTLGGDHAPAEPLAPLSRGPQIDGILHFPTLHPLDDQALERLIASGKPCVVLDRPLPHSEVPQVYIDNYEAGCRVAREFLDRGHKEFLFIWGLTEYPSAQNRFLGFRDELKKAGINLPLERQLEGEYFSLSTYQQTTRRWSSLPPFTAVFASNDSSAVGFMKAAREHGKSAPQDYSIVGFDDNQEMTLLSDPPLSTFRQPAGEIGRAAARMILTLMEGEPLITTKVALEAEFIPRESLGPAPR